MCSKRKLWVKSIYFSFLIASNHSSTRISCSGVTCVLLWGKRGVSRVFNPDGSLHFFPNISSHLWRAERAARERVLHFHVSFRVLLSRDFSRLPPLAGYVASNSYNRSLLAPRSLRACARTRFARALNSGELVNRMRLNKNNEGGGNRRCWNQKWREKLWRMIIADSWKKPPRKRFKVSGQYHSNVELFLLV